MGAARFSTSKLLLLEHGPTITLEKFRDLFFPSATIKTMRNKCSRGDVPQLRNGVMDSQEVGDWWDDYCAATAPRAA